MNEPDFLTTQELADWLRISRYSVYRHITQGLPHYRIGPHHRFKRVEVEAWMREQAEASRPQPVKHVPAQLLKARREPELSTAEAIKKLKEIMG